MNHPNYKFWERLEKVIRELADIGIETDLILFHPYDRWGPQFNSVQVWHRRKKDVLDPKDGAYCGHYEVKAIIKYYGIQQPGRSCMFLPKNHTYRVELIDTGKRKKSVLMNGASGTVWFDIPGKEKMSVSVLVTHYSPEQPEFPAAACNSGISPFGTLFPSL